MLILSDFLHRWSKFVWSWGSQPWRAEHEVGCWAGGLVPGSLGQAPDPTSTWRHFSGQLAQGLQDWGQEKALPQKWKYELGHPAANTKSGPRHIHTVWVWGGDKKYWALRLDVGSFSWGSECCTRKTRITDVVYNASNNELVHTKTLVKNCIVLIDSTCTNSGTSLTIHCPWATRRGPGWLLRRNRF